MNKPTFEKVALFAGLSAAEVQLLAAHGVTRHYPKGAIIINEGDASDSLYLIDSGRVKVYMGDAQGREVILGLLGTGEHVGELSLLDEAPRAASVMTLEPSQVTVFTKAAFQACLAEHPELAFNLIRSLVRRLRATNTGVKSLALMDVYGRVANTLLDLSEKRDGRHVIEPRPTHQDIANMVGSSREMVSRILKELTRGGYITVNSKNLVINDRLPPGW